MKERRALMACWVGLVCIAGGLSARAELVAYEGFDYVTVPVRTNLTGLAGGLTYPSYGWGGAWVHNYQTGDDPSAISAGSLTRTGVETHGNKLSLFRNANRLLAHTVGGTSGTVWCGAMFYATNLKRIAYYRLISGGVTQLSLISDRNPANGGTGHVLLDAVDTGITSKASTQFFLLRIDFSPAGNTAYLWVDPNLSAEPSIGTANATKTYASNWSFNKVEVANSSAGSQSCMFDEIRIGTTFRHAISGTYKLPAGTVVVLK